MRTVVLTPAGAGCVVAAPARGVTTSSASCAVDAARAQSTREAPLASLDVQPQRDALSRRAATASLFCAPFTLLHASAAAADDVASRVFFDVSVDGAPLGRIVVGVDAYAPRLAAERFVALARGVQGIGYRRTPFDLIRPGRFVRAAGVRQFSYDAGSAAPVPGGETADELLPELLRPGSRRHDAAGVVSLVVLPEVEPAPPKERLVAMGGKLVTVRDRGAPRPNGTGLTFTLAPAPELDGLNVVVGRVVEGLDVLAALGELPYNKPKDDSPFFAVAKSIGDTRATVAEKGFGRPLGKVMITAAGVL